jgi:hypothetical protein
MSHHTFPNSESDAPYSDTRTSRVIPCILNLGQAKSKTAQARDHNDMLEKWMAQAVEMYRDEQAKGDGEKKLGLKKVCEAMQARCWEADHVQINLDKETLRRRLAGVKSQAKPNRKSAAQAGQSQN